MMPLRSPSRIYWASANGSPEAIQEFVVRESSRNPHCLGRPASAAMACPFSHTCLYCLPFPTRHSGKAQCQRRALASTPLAGAHLLKILFRMAPNLRLALERRCFKRRGKSSGCVFFLRNGDSGPFCPHEEASLSFRGFATKRMASGIYCLLFHFRCLVRLSFHFIQTGDQNFWSSDHGADRPYGTGFRRSAETVDEAMRLCGRPDFHSLDQILSSIGTELRRLEWHASNPGHRIRQKLAGCRLSDPGFLFLLAFAANLEN